MGAMATGRRNPEVVICGGGLAGAAAAITLARGGREVVLIEKSAEMHDKVCGEFLSAESLEALDALGVNAALFGAAPIDTVCVAGRLAGQSVRLPFRAMSLTRRLLDEAVLQCAVDAGATVLRGWNVRGLHRIDDAWAAEYDGPEGRDRMPAKAVFIATGKHDLHGRPRPQGGHNDLVAFKIYLQLSPDQTRALERRVELIMYGGGYAGLQLVENHVANLCCLIRKSKLHTLDGGWPTVLESMLRDSWWLRRRLHDAQPLLTRPLAVGALPYGFVRRDAMDAGLWAIGDQAAVVPSFTGDGMSLALNSGRMAAEMYMEGASSSEFQQRLHAQVSGKIATATRISRWMVAQPTSSAVELGSVILPWAMRWIASSTRLMPRR
jgi:flavin-dependent dehydrogenase